MFRIIMVRLYSCWHPYPKSPVCNWVQLHVQPQGPTNTLFPEKGYFIFGVATLYSRSPIKPVRARGSQVHQLYP